MSDALRLVEVAYDSTSGAVIQVKGEDLMLPQAWIRPVEGWDEERPRWPRGNMEVPLPIWRRPWEAVGGPVWPAVYFPIHAGALQAHAWVFTTLDPMNNPLDWAEVALVTFLDPRCPVDPRLSESTERLRHHAQRVLDQVRRLR